MGGASGSVLPPHQDSPYSTHLNNFFTVWVPLVSITEDIGGIIAYKGSHVSEPIDHSPGQFWAHGIDDSRLEYEKQHILMEKGDALFFPENFIHSSAPQRNPKAIRYSIDFRVVLNRNDTTKSYFDARQKKIVRKH
jgi:ectoine hydroxylase-related dioxygenase (phytanoyl-CoA dioxygenase family)